MILINGKEISITRFPDNTFKFDFEEETLNSVCNTIKWKFESMEELFLLIGLSSELKCGKVKLILPYLPNARMDKTQNDMEGFMLKYFVETLDNLGFEEIILLDPHSQVYKEFVKKTKWTENTFLLKNQIMQTIVHLSREEESEITLVYPDKGAKNRYSKILKNDVGVYGEKVRNQMTGDIISFDLVGEVNNNPILIIDDICSRGGTFYFTAKKLREKGFKGNIYLYVSHCEDTIFEGDLLNEDSQIKKVFTTNSLLTKEHNKIVVYKI